MKIKIPHIAYTVHIKDVKKSKGEVAEFLGKYLACTQEVDRYSSIIWIPMPIRKSEIPTLCHELIHVLQNICKGYNIDFVKEEEHTAYIYHFMLNSILGYKYDN